jgi:lysophospholipase L1-like esterase
MQARTAVVATVLTSCAVAWSGCGSPSKPTPPPVFDPPEISCPDPQTLRSLLGDPITVVYGDATVTKGKPPVATTCDPPSSSIFPIGETTITCTATDAAQRAASCTLLVTVLPPLRLSVARFVAFGDSLTLGEDGNSLRLMPWGYQTFQLPPGQQYPGALQNELRARYTLQSPTVVNKGAGGELVSDAGTPVRFSGVVNGGQYDVVLLMEGSNDANAIPRDSLVEPAAIANLRLMVRNAKSRRVRAYLATIPPENPNGFRGVGAAVVPEFNDRIRALAVSEGVPLVDVYAALNTDISTYIGFDGLHPTKEGYAQMADVFLTAIEQTLEVPPPSSILHAPGSLSAVPAVIGRSRPRAR